MKTYNLRFTVNSDDEKLEMEVKELVENYLANRKNKQENISTEDISFEEIRFISLKAKGSSGIQRKIRQHDIIYIEKSGHSSLVVTHFETLRVNMSFARLINELDPKLFLRSHQGYIVNIKEIKSISTYGIQLFGCEKLIPLSRTGRLLLEQKSYFS